MLNKMAKFPKGVKQNSAEILILDKVKFPICISNYTLAQNDQQTVEIYKFKYKRVSVIYTIYKLYKQK